MGLRGENVLAAGDLDELAHPADAADHRLVPLLEIDLRPPLQLCCGLSNFRQTILQPLDEPLTAIGRAEIWPVHQRTAELGGMLRTGLEDTFYLPDGSRARGNGELIDALAACARRAGREVASPAQARARLGLA